VVVPAGLDSWAPARLADGSGDVLHLTPAEAMGLVGQLLDAVHEVDPDLCCGDSAPPDVEWCPHPAGDIPVWAI
jgi:hypothetical protein